MKISRHLSVIISNIYIAYLLCMYRRYKYTQFFVNHTMCRTVSPIVPLVLTNTMILESIPSQPLRAHPTIQRY